MSKQVVTKKRESTKHYDEVATKIRKIISAGVTYMGDLCDALKEDWYPHLTEDMIQHNHEIRSEMKEKILNDWSKDRNDEGLWQDKYIIFHMRDWLKDQSRVEGGLKSGEKRQFEKFRTDVEKQRRKLDNIAEQLPQPPRESHKQTFEITDDSQIKSITDDDPLFRKLGDKGQDVIGQYGKLFGPLQDLIEGLTDKRLIPNPDEDRFNEYIKPSRERFMSVYHEVDQRMQVDLYNGFVYLEEMLADRIEQMDKTRVKK